MKITIIGKVNPRLTYEEWVCKFQTNVDVTNVTQINITIGNGLLNQYVRRYAQSNNLTLIENAPDFNTYGAEAKLRRNISLVQNSNLIVGFMPESSLSSKSRILRPGIVCEKDAKIIMC